MDQHELPDALGRIAFVHPALFNSHVSQPACGNPPLWRARRNRRTRRASFGARAKAVAPGPAETGMLNRFTDPAERKTALLKRARAIHAN